MNPLWIDERAWSRASLLDSGRHFEGLQRSEESRVRIDGPRVPIDQHGTWPAAWIGGLFSYSHATLAFFEAYFSNFIEGTEFAVDEAADIAFRGVVPNERPADAHDVLGTWRIVSDTREMGRTPTDAGTPAIAASTTALNLLFASCSGHSVMSACSVQVNWLDRWSGRIECRRGMFRPIDAGHDRFILHRMAACCSTNPCFALSTHRRLATSWSEAWRRSCTAMRD
ncbi:MAG: hypothetical protein OXI73_17235 [Rhodospirillales bacterium]|nr:hypothetical protein [Rhodospirillales bacterium]